MKKQLSPPLVAAVVVLTFLAVLTVYWKGLLRDKEGGEPGEMAGGAGMPPPPLVGLPGIQVTTVAGPAPQTAGALDISHRDGSCQDARFDGPSGITFARDGSLLVSDTRNHRLRRIGPDGQVTTLAGSGPYSTVTGAHVDGPATGARFWCPVGLGETPDGVIILADSGNHRVRRLSGGTVTTVSGGDTPEDSLGLQSGGLADGPGATARFAYPTDLAAMPDGSVLVVDTGNRRVRRVAPDGTTSTYADLSPAGAKEPCGIALSASGIAFVADPAAQAIFQVAPGGSVSRLPGPVPSPIWIRPTGIAVDASGILYVTDTGSHCLMRVAPGGAPQLIAGVVSVDAPGPGYGNGEGDKARFSAPCDIAIGPDGALYIADFGNNCVRKVVIPPGI